ncbi:hypothetical protein BKA62DRAFT_825003 [Auriculariales sp. MPI-PUGE-AT-0066]|nr:hypothetical protein BKA62DRAFT_825003 [Auriculariales sp. MPI-PUGE-AT-0066]
MDAVLASSRPASPAWRIRRRPCPFYQANRCLFANSCNFLHIVQPSGPSIVLNSASPQSIARTSVDSSIRGFNYEEDEDEDEDDDEDEDSSLSYGKADDELDSQTQDEDEEATNQPLTTSTSSTVFGATATSTPVGQHPHSLVVATNHPEPPSDPGYTSSPPTSGLGLILTPVSPPRPSRQEKASFDAGWHPSPSVSSLLLFDQPPADSPTIHALPLAKEFRPRVLPSARATLDDVADLPPLPPTPSDESRPVSPLAESPADVSQVRLLSHNDNSATSTSIATHDAQPSPSTRTGSRPQSIELPQVPRPTAVRESSSSQSVEHPQLTRLSAVRESIDNFTPSVSVPSSPHRKTRSSFRASWQASPSVSSPLLLGQPPTDSPLLKKFRPRVLPSARASLHDVADLPPLPLTPSDESCPSSPLAAPPTAPSKEDQLLGDEPRSPSFISSQDIRPGPSTLVESSPRSVQRLLLSQPTAARESIEHSVPSTVPSPPQEQASLDAAWHPSPPVSMPLPFGQPPTGSPEVPISPLAKKARPRVLHHARVSLHDLANLPPLPLVPDDEYRPASPLAAPPTPPPKKNKRLDDDLRLPTFIPFNNVPLGSSNSLESSPQPVELPEAPKPTAVREISSLQLAESPQFPQPAELPEAPEPPAVREISSPQLAESPRLLQPAAMYESSNARPIERLDLSPPTAVQESSSPQPIELPELPQPMTVRENPSSQQVEHPQLPRPTIAQETAITRLVAELSRSSAMQESFSSQPAELSELSQPTPLRGHFNSPSVEQAQLPQPNAVQGSSTPLVLEPSSRPHSPPIIGRRGSQDSTTSPDSASETGFHASRPWLKPLRLGSSASASDADPSSLPPSRRSSTISITSMHSPHPPSGPLRQRSRPPSLLPLETAYNSGRASVLTPTSASSPHQQHYRVPTSTRSYSLMSPAVLSPPPLSSPRSAPLLPTAQIFTSASRSLSPPHNQPLFSISQALASPPVRPTTPSPPPSIYSPSIAAADKASSALFFAIASDDNDRVAQSLREDTTITPDLRLGPQETPALEFAITNPALSNKLSIVKSLLEHGADPNVLYSSTAAEEELKPQVKSNMNPAMNYYVERAAALAKDKSAEILRNSDISGATGIAFRLVGQDCMLRRLQRALKVHVSGAVSTPFVAVFTGPSGLGKSYLAKQFGDVLGIPSLVINLSSLRSQTSLLDMRPAVGSSQTAGDATLQEFIAAHEGRRCVVVLEDIEKVEDINALHSLIVPFELGRFLMSSGLYVDTSKVLWFATSSLGTTSVLDAQLAGGDSVSDQQYGQLMKDARTELVSVLKAPLVSRIATVLPFVPFSDVEKSVLVCEAASALLARIGESYDPETMDAKVQEIVQGHLEIDGRGLLRAVAEQF